MTPHKNVSSLGVYGNKKSEQWQKWAIGIIIALIVMALLVASDAEPTKLDCLLATGRSALCN